MAVANDRWQHKGAAGERRVDPPGYLCIYDWKGWLRVPALASGHPDRVLPDV